MREYVILQGGQGGSYQHLRTIEASSLDQATEKGREIANSKYITVVPKTHWNISRV